MKRYELDTKVHDIDNMLSMEQIEDYLRCRKYWELKYIDKVPIDESDMCAKWVKYRRGMGAAWKAYGSGADKDQCVAAARAISDLAGSHFARYAYLYDWTVVAQDIPFRLPFRKTTGLYGHIPVILQHNTYHGKVVLDYRMSAIADKRLVDMRGMIGIYAAWKWGINANGFAVSWFNGDTYMSFPTTEQVKDVWNWHVADIIKEMVSKRKRILPNATPENCNTCPVFDQCFDSFIKSGFVGEKL